MKLSKELEEEIDKAIKEYEEAKRENKVVFYTEEEAFKIMFGENYIGSIGYIILLTLRGKLAKFVIIFFMN